MQSVEKTMLLRGLCQPCHKAAAAFWRGSCRRPFLDRRQGHPSQPTPRLCLTTTPSKASGRRLIAMASSGSVKQFHDLAGLRFVLAVGDEEAYVSYHLDQTARTIDLQHTFTPVPMRGKGAAGKVLSPQFTHVIRSSLPSIRILACPLISAPSQRRGLPPSVFCACLHSFKLFSTPITLSHTSLGCEGQRYDSNV